MTLIVIGIAAVSISARVQWSPEGLLRKFSSPPVHGNWGTASKDSGKQMFGKE